MQRKKILDLYALKKLLVAVVCCVALLGAQAQTVDEVIAKYVTVLGGPAKLKALRSLRIKGTMQVQGIDMEVKSTILHGVGIRNDITVPGIATSYQIITPTKGWNYTPFSGPTKPQPLTATQISAGQPNLDLQGSLLDYKKKGHKAELLAMEMVDSLNCYRIKLTYKTGEVAHYFIDTQNFHRVKLITTEIVNGVPIEKATIYSDFRRTPEGYLLPYTQINNNGAMQVTQVTVNPPVKPSLFTVK